MEGMLNWRETIDDKVRQLLEEFGGLENRASLS